MAVEGWFVVAAPNCMPRCDNRVSRRSRGRASSRGKDNSLPLEAQEQNEWGCSCHEKMDMLTPWCRTPSGRIGRAWQPANPARNQGARCPSTRRGGSSCHS